MDSRIHEPPLTKTKEMLRTQSIEFLLSGGVGQPDDELYVEQVLTIFAKLLRLRVGNSRQSQSLFSGRYLGCVRIL